MRTRSQQTATTAKTTIDNNKISNCDSDNKNHNNNDDYTIKKEIYCINGFRRTVCIEAMMHKSCIHIVDLFGLYIYFYSIFFPCLFHFVHFNVCMYELFYSFIHSCVVRSFVGCCCYLVLQCAKQNKKSQ